MTTGLNIDLRHQYQISITESQTSLLVKCPQQCGAWRVGLNDDMLSWSL